jgi:hypothetical protein
VPLPRLAAPLTCSGRSIDPDSVDPADIDEVPRPGELPPAQWRLAEEKARTVMPRIPAPYPGRRHGQTPPHPPKPST